MCVNLPMVKTIDPETRKMGSNPSPSERFILNFGTRNYKISFAL